MKLPMAAYDKDDPGRHAMSHDEYLKVGNMLDKRMPPWRGSKVRFSGWDPWIDGQMGEQRTVVFMVDKDCVWCAAVPSAANPAPFPFKLDKVIMMSRMIGGTEIPLKPMEF
jgi:hypothetical protein